MTRVSKGIERARRSINRKSRSARQRNQLLEIAADQVGRFGPAGLAPAQIAAQCGLAKSTVYHHLGDHQNILNQLALLLIRAFDHQFAINLRDTAVSEPTLMKAYARTVNGFIAPNAFWNRGAALLRLRLGHELAQHCWQARLEVTVGQLRTRERIRELERTLLRVDAIWLHAVLDPDPYESALRDHVSEARLMEQLLRSPRPERQLMNRLKLSIRPKEQLERIFDPRRELNWFGPYRTVPLSRYDAYY